MFFNGDWTNHWQRRQRNKNEQILIFYQLKQFSEANKMYWFKYLIHFTKNMSTLVFGQRKQSEGDVWRPVSAAMQWAEVG